MMKKRISLLLALVLLLGVFAAPTLMFAEEEEAKSLKDVPDWDGTEAEFHIGLVTGTVSQSEDDLRGAEELIRRYGDSKSGGMITHLTYPDNFMSEQETTISQIVGLADDPLMKVIVVNQAVPGTAAAFNQIREFRDDILLLAGESHEDPTVITPAADYCVSVDKVGQGYLMPYAAKELGAKTFVHVSFPRHLSQEIMAQRHAILAAACEELGIDFADETAPDPMSDIGIPGAQQFILEHMNAWVDKYGTDTAFFCTNDAETEPMLKKVAELGAFFIEADLPSPLMGYPGAFGIELKDVAGDWPAILKKVEEAVVKAGGGEHMGTWAYSFGFTCTAGLGEFGKRVVEGEYEKDPETETFKPEDILACFEEYTPGCKWTGGYFMNTTGDEPEPWKNFYLVSQDLYVFDKGFLGLDEVEVPQKYREMAYEVKTQEELEAEAEPEGN
ncbi:MAG: DUF3798 domain-containing protein [Clostridiales bacterium]|nr:DUF3798 domain-containing protein [Clostridiales bacterium]